MKNKFEMTPMEARRRGEGVGRMSYLRTTSARLL